jgi:hypothetical protein
MKVYCQLPLSSVKSAEGHGMRAGEGVRPKKGVGIMKRR